MLELKGVTKQYAYGKRLFGVLDLTVNDGEIIALYGGEKSGKTAFLKMLSGIEEYEGSISIDGKKISSKTNDVIMYFDDGAVFKLKSVYENLAYPLKIRKVPKDVVKQRVNDVAIRFGIADKLKEKAYRLSTLDSRKMSLARLFIRPAKMLLVDDFTVGLDDDNAQALFDDIAKSLLDEAKANGTIVVYATSKSQRAFSIADKVVVLVDGDIKQIGDFDTIWDNPTSIWSAEAVDDNYIVKKAKLTADYQLNIDDYIIDINALKSSIVDGFTNKDIWCGWHSVNQIGNLPEIQKITLFDINENSIMKKEKI